MRSRFPMRTVDLEAPRMAAAKIIEGCSRVAGPPYASRRGTCMIAADNPDRRSARLLVVEADGTMRDLPRTGLATLFDPGDLVVANDAATLPASLYGTHVASGETIEIRLAGWLSLPDPTRFVAIAFGTGDHRTPRKTGRLRRRCQRATACGSARLKPS